MMLELFINDIYCLQVQESSSSMQGQNDLDFSEFNKIEDIQDNVFRSLRESINATVHVNRLKVCIILMYNYVFS